MPKPQRDVGSGQARFRVLSLDDNPDILSILRLCLEGSYEFWGTDDEAAAMCLLSFADRIDVFTQDLERPCGIGGCEFLRLLRAHPKLREIPVLLISGYPASAIRERLEGAGIPIDRNVAFLAKPFTRTQLRFTIRSMLPGDVN